MKGIDALCINLSGESIHLGWIAYEEVVRTQLAGQMILTNRFWKAWAQPCTIVHMWLYFYDNGNIG